MGSATGVEGILQDDGGGLTVHPRPVRLALRWSRWAAGASTPHRPEALLGEAFAFFKE